MAEETFELKFEWKPGEGVRLPALAATMARLEVRAGDQCVTLAFDSSNRCSIEGTYVSLMPLANWAVDCWWFAMHEGPRANRVRSLRHRSVSKTEAQWHRRHGWLSFREGFAFPEIVFSSDSEQRVRLDWFADPPGGVMPLRFLNSGHATIQRDVVESELTRLVDAVLARCEGLEEPGLKALRERWDIIRSASQTERAACQRAARLGLDALDADEVDEELSRFLEASPPVEETVFGEMLEVVDDLSLDRMEEQSAKLARLIECANEPTGRSWNLESWGRAREHVANVNPSGWPFERGYCRAQALRKDVLAVDEKVVGAALDDALDRVLLGTTTTREDDQSFVYPGLRGLVAHTASGPFLATRAFLPRAGRFERARCLHMLLIRNGTSLVTTSFAPDQQASRAFAAELLAPSAWLKARIRNRLLDSNSVTALAHELGVSELVIQHQVENHRLAEVVEE